MTQLGADPHALRELSASMRSSSRQLDDVALRLERRVREAGWRGPDAERFAGRWQGHRSELRRLSDRCHQLAGSLGQQAQQQLDASGPTGPSSASSASTPAAMRPTSAGVRLPAFPTSEDRYIGGLDVRVGPVVVSLIGDLVLQRLTGGRTRIVVAQHAGLGGTLSAGATTQASISDEIAAPVPATGGVADARGRLGAVVRRSWEVDDDQVGTVLARIAAESAADQVVTDTRAVPIAGGWLDAVVEGVTGVDPNFDERLGWLLTAPPPDRIETLGEVEVAGLVGAALGGGSASVGASVNPTATIRFGRSMTPDGSSQVLELSGGTTATIGGSMLKRLGLTVPGGWRSIATARIELPDDGPPMALVRLSGVEGSHLDELVARIDLSGPALAGSSSQLRAAAAHLAMADIDRAMAALGRVDVPVERVTLATSSGEITGTTARAGASASAGLGAGFTVRGQVLHVDRVT